MPIYYCPDCWHDNNELEDLKAHIRKAHPERIDTSFNIEVGIYVEKKGRR